MKAVQRKRKIPTEWLLFLMMWKGVNPEWVLRGKGPWFLAHSRAGVYETGEEWEAWRREREALGEISSLAMMDELMRRLAVQQAS